MVFWRRVFLSQSFQTGMKPSPGGDIFIYIYIGTVIYIYISSWWFQEFLFVLPLPGEMIQFDYMIFFKWVESTS